MIFSVEAWDPEYGTGGDIDALEASTDVVHAGVEVPVGQWAPITPTPDSTPRPGVIYFVDGVRRIDARVWVTNDGRVLPGTCATVAAGSVACSADAAVVHDVAVQRAFFTPPTPGATSIVTEFGAYKHTVIKTGAAEDLYLGIHEAMTHLETQIVPMPGPDDLVVFDGPLRGRVGERTIGLIKTQHVQYLELEEQQVVTNLDAGQRSPLFTIGSRFSWYLRLPGPRTHGWAGIVRCEAPTNSPERCEASLDGPEQCEASLDGPEQCEASLNGPSSAPAIAANLADRVATTLPRYASEPHKEHRAPQNLYPIKGLENALRRRLGDQRLLQRALRKASVD